MSLLLLGPPDGPPESRAPGPSISKMLRFLAAIASGCAVAALPGSAALGLQSVRVIGNAAVPTGEVLRRAGVAPGLNVFHVNARSIRQRLSEDPRIAEVTVALAFPRHLTIAIRERPPVAALRAGDAYTLVAKDGVAIAQVPVPGPLPTLVVDRLHSAEVSVGALTGSPDVRLGAQVAAALPDLLKPHVASVHVDEVGEASLELRDGVVVRLGGAPVVPDRLGLVPQVLEAMAARSVRVEYVDLRFSGSIVIQPVRSPGQAAAGGKRKENSRSCGIDPAMHRPSIP